MSVRNATPYLILGNKAPEALRFYERELGAKVEKVQRFGDVVQGCPEAQRDNIMHAELRLGGALLMMSQGPEENAPSPGPGAVSVALDVDDAATLKKLFTALSARGKVVADLHPAFWGGTFGTVTDEFGVNWMMSGPALT